MKQEPQYAGYDSITIHLKGQSRRVKFDPNDPAEVAKAALRLVGYEVAKVVVTEKPDPRYAAWKNAVAQDRTTHSFEEFCEAGVYK